MYMCVHILFSVLSYMCSFVAYYVRRAAGARATDRRPSMCMCIWQVITPNLPTIIIPTKIA